MEVTTRYSVELSQADQFTVLNTSYVCVRAHAHACRWQKFLCENMTYVM